MRRHQSQESPVTAILRGKAHPHDDDDEHDAHKDNDSPLEPLLTILWAEANLGQIAHEIAVSREFFADSGTD
jgi:hypothetical protein